MSRMNRLYGVTMPEKGISKIVAVNLEKAEELVAWSLMTDLEDFKTRLKIAKSKLDKNNLKKTSERSIFLGNAFKLGTELVAAVVVGTIIGFILDSWFDTKPILILIFFLFGAIAGIVNVIKAAKRMQKNRD